MKFVLIMLSGIGIGIALTRLPYIKGALAKNLPAPQGRSEGARMASELRRTCRQLDPLLAQVEAAYADRNLSPGDILAIYQQTQRLS